MNDKRPRWEYFLVAFVIILAFSFVFYAKFIERRMSDEYTLAYELQSLRASLALYKEVKKEDPNNLEEMINASFVADGEKKVFVNITLDDGRPIDPFGNPYYYDMKASWIKSSTPGFTSW